MNKRNWKIIYSSFSGLEKKAVELISKEMGALMLRDKGIYRIHVLSCEHVKAAKLDKNAVVIGLYDENDMIRKYVEPSAISRDGYVVKVMDQPEDPSHKLVLITAKTAAGLYYGAVDFVDDYFAVATSAEHHPIMLKDEIFDFPLPDYYSASAPAIKTRTVFTWGHPINDYRNYIENMARLRLNQLIIWNDYVPLNAKEIVDYAHEFGIQVIWGFTWGWSRDCTSIDLDSLDALGEEILQTYGQQYQGVGDGIYFQSFTETDDEKIGGRLIAEAVMNFVNVVSAKLLDRYPDLFIQFGLHADSVKHHLEYIAKVDPRVEIVWENCGAFPYAGDPVAEVEPEYANTLALTKNILNLRENGSTGILFKGFLTLDWCGDRFVHQAGPFILGMSDTRLIDHDMPLLRSMWRHFQTGWILNGAYAHRMARYVHEADSNATLGMAGQFAGGIWFAEALCAQILWDCDKPYQEVFEKVSRRRCVDIV